MEKKPDEFIPTRASLLSRLKDWEDHDSWREFFNIYRRLIYSTAIKAGLTEHEAEEALQETFISVAKTIKEFKYDRNRCTFKSWLGHLTRKRIADQFRKRARERLVDRAPASGTSETPLIERVPDAGAARLEAVWDEEWQQQLLAAAMERVKAEANSEQYQMFDLYVLRKMPAGKVAAALDTNIGQVYLAKHRIAKLIKQVVKQLETKMNQNRNHEPAGKSGRR